MKMTYFLSGFTDKTNYNNFSLILTNSVLPLNLSMSLVEKMCEQGVNDTQGFKISMCEQGVNDTQDFKFSICQQGVNDTQDFKISMCEDSGDLFILLGFPHERN